MSHKAPVPQSSSMFKKINFILKRSEKKKLLLLFFGTLLLSISEVCSIGIIIPIMDLFVNQEKIKTSFVFNWLYGLTEVQDTTFFLYILIITAIIVFIIKAVFSVFMIYIQQSLAGKIYNRITTSLLTSYLNKPYEFHLENNSSVLFKNVTTEVAHFKAGVLIQFQIICTEIIILFAIFSFLLWTYPRVTLFMISLFSFVIILMYYFQRNRIKTYSAQRQVSNAEFFKSGMEALSGIKEIQVYNVQSLFLNGFSEGIKKYTNSIVKFTAESSAPRYILETLLFTSILSGMLICVYANVNRMEIFPMMAALGVASIRVLPSIYKIYAGTNTLGYYSNSVEIVYKILKEDVSWIESNTINQTNEGYTDGHLQDISKPASIRIEGMEFKYRSANSPIFKDLDFIIPLNKTVAFVGESGAGKSTLINILMGLLTPSKGTFYYGQTEITPKNIPEYRKRVGYVPQEIFFTDDTIEANIVFGKPNNQIDYNKLNQVLKMSQLESFIKELPEGTKTLIGEKGVKLSGGQRQRTGIARALYRNPEILILDEATSSLDGYTETEISRAIENLSGSLTIIIVAHRLSTIEHADIIYVMDKGKIVDKGTFAELKQHSLIFRKIANSQVAV